MDLIQLGWIIKVYTYRNVYVSFWNFDQANDAGTTSNRRIFLAWYNLCRNSRLLCCRWRWHSSRANCARRATPALFGNWVRQARLKPRPLAGFSRTCSLRAELLGLSKLSRSFLHYHSEFGIKDTHARARTHRLATIKIHSRHESHPTGVDPVVFAHPGHPHLRVGSGAVRLDPEPYSHRGPKLEDPPRYSRNPDDWLHPARHLGDLQSHLNQPEIGLQPAGHHIFRQPDHQDRPGFDGGFPYRDSDRAGRGHPGGPLLERQAQLASGRPGGTVDLPLGSHDHHPHRLVHPHLRINLISVPDHFRESRLLHHPGLHRRNIWNPGRLRHVHRDLPLLRRKEPRGVAHRGGHGRPVRQCQAAGETNRSAEPGPAQERRQQQRPVLEGLHGRRCVLPPGQEPGHPGRQRLLRRQTLRRRPLRRRSMAHNLDTTMCTKGLNNGIIIIIQRLYNIAHPTHFSKTVFTILEYCSHNSVTIWHIGGIG